MLEELADSQREKKSQKNDLCQEANVCLLTLLISPQGSCHVISTILTAIFVSRCKMHTRTKFLDLNIFNEFLLSMNKKETDKQAKPKILRSS